MGWWFGRKAAPADARALVPAWLSASEQVGFARSYEAQVEEVFRRNPVGQRSVRLVAGMFGGLTIDGDERALALIQADGLLESLAAQLLLHGNSYAQLIVGDDGAPAEICTLRPERVSVVADERGWPTAYLYRVAGRVTRFERLDALGRRQVAHLKALHPRDDHYGMGCLEAACPAATVHNGASRWNKALLDNAARPSGALVYDPGDCATLSTEQFNRLKEDLAAEFSGSGNAGRPLLLEGGLRWQAMSLTPADMDFIGLKAGAAREIALAFGVPPLLLGLPSDVTYANYREANRALWRQTVLPMADRILRGLSDALAAWWPGLKLEIDLDRIGALSGERERLWRQLNAADFLTDAEKREMLGFAPRTEDEAAGARA